MNEGAFPGCHFSIQGHETITCYPWSSLPTECSKQVFLSIPQLSWSFVPTCLKRVVGIKFRISIYLNSNIAENKVFLLFFFLIESMSWLGLGLCFSFLWYQWNPTTCWQQSENTWFYVGIKASYLIHTRQIQRGRAARGPQDTSPLVVAMGKTHIHTQTHRHYHYCHSRDVADASE